MSNVLHGNCLYFQVPEHLITGGVFGNMTESEAGRPGSGMAPPGHLPVD
jgi:hypothetical protein